VRALLTHRIAAASDCARSDLMVVRPLSADAWTGLGPPELHHRGERARWDVSLSHDGRWIAAAAKQISDR
jgi:hypothetical protein